MNTFNEVIERYAAQIRTADVIEIADIPTIDLYMDQVTTFMDKGLARYKRNETDKILTKTTRPPDATGSCTTTCSVRGMHVHPFQQGHLTSFPR